MWEELALRRWLVHINERDPAIIQQVLDQCSTDLDAKAYFLKRAEEVPGAPEGDTYLRTHLIHRARAVLTHAVAIYQQ